MDPSAIRQLASKDEREDENTTIQINVTADQCGQKVTVRPRATPLNLDDGLAFEE